MKTRPVTDNVVPLIMSPAYFVNPGAKDYICEEVIERDPIQNYHKSLPDFHPSPLIPISLPSSTHNPTNLRIFFKDESNRLGLPSFKVLGASWGVYRALSQRLNLHLNPEGLPMIDLSSLSRLSQQQNLTLSAATDGNHGRAIARMAKILGLKARIYVPVNYVAPSTISNIASEGATIIHSQQDYDGAVTEAYLDSQKPENLTSVVYVQDTAFEGYTEIPSWIVDGYTTMLAEVDSQLQSLLHHNGNKDNAKDSRSASPTYIIIPVGVGSLAHAVVKHAKSPHRKSRICVITVEPESAACLNQALHHGAINSTSSQRNSTKDDDGNDTASKKTIMEGMNCATVSSISWPALRDGVDLSITVSDRECHEALMELYALRPEVKTGPCGAAAYAALKKVLVLQKVGGESEIVGVDKGERAGLNGQGFPAIGAESVIVLLGTEGPREYQVPIRE